MSEKEENDIEVFVIATIIVIIGILAAIVLIPIITIGCLNSLFNTDTAINFKTCFSVWWFILIMCIPILIANKKGK